MSDINDIRKLFKIPKTTADAMKTNLDNLKELDKVSGQLKSLGIVDDKSIQQIHDLTKLTTKILEQFPVDETESS